MYPQGASFPRVKESCPRRHSWSNSTSVYLIQPMCQLAFDSVSLGTVEGIFDICRQNNGSGHKITRNKSALHQTALKQTRNLGLHHMVVVTPPFTSRVTTEKAPFPWDSCQGYWPDSRACRIHLSLISSISLSMVSGLDLWLYQLAIHPGYRDRRTGSCSWRPMGQML